MPNAITLFLVAVLLLTACNSQTQNTPVQSSTSSSSVEPLTRITQEGKGVSVHSQPLAVSRGQMILVPVYSHIYQGNKQEQFLLSVTLSIRNTSLTNAIVLRSVRYYNSKGTLAKKYTEGNLQIAPLASVEFFIPQQDTSGGSGANFIVEWVTDQKNVTEPIVEAVMISTSFQQGVSFTTSGRVIEEIKP